MPHASPLVKVMISAARDAAKLIRRDYYELSELQVRRKGAADFVTQADLKAEEAIFQSLSKARPKYGFLMEERGEVEGSDNSNRFIVDPLDGTTNFMHSIPQFCISIGLERDRQPHAGVVFSPITDELFYAEKGFGAFCNDKRIRVSGRDDLSEALVGCGFPYKGRPGRERAFQETNRVLEETAGVRRFGSAAYDLCMTAMGRLDAFWERGLNSWDVAAGIVIVREAGGEVSTIDGGPGHPHEAENLVATNHTMHNDMLALLRG